jgi:drug/metabolite transporter (DMT)-like permease
MMHLWLLLACLTAAGGQLLLKLGAEGRTQFMEFINPYALAGLSGYAISCALWLYCLSKLPLRVVYPYTALTFALVIAGAWLFLGERFGMRALLGTGLVLAGLVMLTLDSGPTR